MLHVSPLFKGSLRATRVAIALIFSALVSVHSVSAQAPPAPWVARDIGSPAIAGSTTYSSGTYTISAAGVDIWSTSDQFHFVYQQITGDVDVMVRVQSISKANSWSKTGVMIRESLTGSSRHAFALLSASNGYAYQTRIDPGGFSNSISGVTGVAPGWVRLVRTGSRSRRSGRRTARAGHRWVSTSCPWRQRSMSGSQRPATMRPSPRSAVLTNLKVSATAAPQNQPPSRQLDEPEHDGVNPVCSAPTPGVSVHMIAATAFGPPDVNASSPKVEIVLTRAARSAATWDRHPDRHPYSRASSTR